MVKPLAAVDLQTSQGEAVLALLERTKVPPLPRFYGLFYDYVAGVKGLFSARLDSLLGNADMARDAGRMHDAVYREFVAPYESSDQDFAATAARIVGRLKVLEELMRDSQKASAAQARSLADARSSLEQDQVGRTLLVDLVARLTVTTETLKAANDTLSDELEVAFSELEETRAQLARSGEVARRDPLTGALNLAGIDMEMSRLASEHAASGTPFSLAVVDIDHFKSLNDTYGHPAGDEVLKLTTRLLRSVLRSADLIGRIGGDEFVVVMPTVGSAAATQAAERICAAVRQYELRDLLGKDVLGNMTVSVGVAEYRRNDSIGALFERADKALYAAKGGGRNRTAGGEP